MATRFAVATGTWDATNTSIWAATSGGAAGASAPTATDDVVFDAASGAVTVTAASGAVANNLTATGFTGSITGATITLNGTTVTLGSGMTATGFIASLQPGAGNTVTFTSGSRTISSINVINGTLSLADAMTMTGNLNHSLGSFITNNFAFTTAGYQSNVSTTRVITLGSSSVTITGGNNAWLVAQSALTMTANTATITMTNGVGGFNHLGGTVNGASLVYTGVSDANIANPVVGLTNLTITGSSSTVTRFTIIGNVTMTGTFTVNGNSAINRLLVQGSAVGTARTISAATVVASNVDLMDIVGAGAANWDLSLLPGVTAAWTTGGTGGNLLPADTSNIETSVAGWVSLAATTLARTTAESFEGSASLAATLTGANGSVSTLTGSSGVPVAAGAGYVAQVRIKAAASARLIYVHLRWYNGSTFLSENAGTTVGADGTWRLGTVRATAPAGATRAAIQVEQYGVAGDVAYIDAAALNLEVVGGSGDAGGNSGITFTTSQTNYWRGNGGNWSDGTHWASTSGGAASSGRVPLPQDSVRFDANSFTSAAQTVIQDLMPRLGKDIDWTGATNSPTWQNSTLALGTTFFGSVTLISGMTFASSTQGMTAAGRGSHTLTTAGKTWANTLSITAPGATYTLQDAFAGGASLILNGGTLNTNNMNVAVSTFTATGTLTRALTLGTSTVTLQGSTGVIWNVTSTGLTLSASSSTILISAVSASDRFLNLAGLTYGTIDYSVAGTAAGKMSLSQGGTIGNLKASGGARTILFSASTTYTVTNWNVFGLVGALVTVGSGTAGTAAIISKVSGYIASDYVSVQDITGSGGATFYMGSRSTNVSGNTGLSFTDAPQRFWVGGTATWDATVGTKWAVVSGGTGGIAVPTSNEDVYFDANSGASTIGVAGGNVALAKNFILTGFAGTWNGSGTVGVAGTALTLGASMTATSLLISLGGQAASSTCTVTSAGKAFAQFSTFTGTTVTTALADAFSVTGTLTHTSGTFTTNNFAVTCGTFTSSNTNVRTLNMGSSSFTVTSTNGFTATVTNLTLNAGTSVLSVFSIASSGGLITFYDVVLQSNGGLASLSSAGMTCHNLTRGTAAVKTDVMQIRSGATLTVTGTLTATGNSATNRLLVQSNTVGTSVTINAATVSMSNIDFMDIAATGTANWDLSAITGGSGDAGGNSGITFTTGAVNYWVGGTGNWSDITHWANSSGGVGGTGRVPLPQGTARFDANSFSSAAQTVTTDMPRAAKDIDWTGATNTPAWTNSIAGGYAIYGSLTMISGMTLVGGTSGPLFNGRGTHTLTSAGKTIQNSVNFSSPGATYTMQDAFGTIGASGITFNAGGFNTGGFTLTTPLFLSNGSGTRTVNLSTSTVNLTATSGTPWNVAATGLTLSAASSTIVISAASASTRSFQSTGGAQTYGTLTYTVAASTGRLAMSTSTGTSFTAINVSGGVRELNFTSGTSTTVTSWNVFGTSGALVLVTASTPGTQATLVKSDGVAVSSNYVNVQDIAASPANTWYAAPGSVNSGNNSGWIFNQAYNVSTADSAPATDAATSRLRGPRSMADTAPATDVVARSAFHSSRATADTAHATDAVTTRLRAVLALTEGMSLSDAVTFIFAVSLRLKDHRSGSWQPTSRLKWYDTSTHTWRVMRIKRNITSTGAWVPAQMESP